MLALAPNMKGRPLLHSEKTIASFIQGLSQQVCRRLAVGEEGRIFLLYALLPLIGRFRAMKFFASYAIYWVS
jgi:hypothetical protein